MLVPIREKPQNMYVHHHASLGLHTRMVVIFDTVQVHSNIGPNTDMVRV